VHLIWHPYMWYLLPCIGPGRNTKTWPYGHELYGIVKLDFRELPFHALG
jgi:hypothetical protein